jgi:hypothetical protein
LERGARVAERALLLAAPEMAEALARGESVDEAVGRLGPGAVAPAYWYVTNLSDFALTKGLTTTVFYKDRILRLAERLVALDETFFHAGPHRTLATFYATAPAPAGGSLTASRQHFERALALAPDYVGTLVSFAELYATKAGDRTLFTELLQRAGAQNKAGPNEQDPEQQIDRQRAQQLLARTDQLF